MIQIQGELCCRTQESYHPTVSLLRLLLVSHSIYQVPPRHRARRFRPAIFILLIGVGVLCLLLWTCAPKL